MQKQKQSFLASSPAGSMVCQIHRWELWTTSLQLKSAERMYFCAATVSWLEFDSITFAFLHQESQPQPIHRSSYPITSTIISLNKGTKSSYSEIYDNNNNSNLSSFFRSFNVAGSNQRPFHAVQRFKKGSQRFLAGHLAAQTTCQATFPR